MLSAVREGGRWNQLRRRAEQLVACPGASGAMGELAGEVLVLRAEAQRQLDEANARLRSAANDRLAAAARVSA